MSVHANEHWNSIVGPVWSSGLDSGSEVPPAATDDAPSAEAMPSAATPAAESYEVRDASGKRIPLTPEQQARFNEIYAERGKFQRLSESAEKTAQDLQTRFEKVQDELYRIQRAPKTAPATPARPGERTLPPELQQFLDDPEWSKIFRPIMDMIGWHLQPVSEAQKRLQEERELNVLESRHSQQQEAEVHALTQIQNRIIGDLKLSDSYSKEQIEDMSDLVIPKIGEQAKQEHWEQLPVERQRMLFELAFRQRMQEKTGLWKAGKKPTPISPEELENAIPAAEIVPGSSGVSPPDQIMQDLADGKIGAGEAARLKTRQALKDLRRKKGT